MGYGHAGRSPGLCLGDFAIVTQLGQEVHPQYGSVQAFLSQRCIAVGSFCPYEFAVHLASRLDAIRQWSREEEVQAVLSTHVDDISVCAVGPEEKKLVDAAAKLSKRMARHLDKLGP